jgi:uncharacterized repeat protein (TIGR01451 family)
MAPTIVSPPSGDTNGQGEVDFDLTRVLANGSEVEITETLKTGYELEGASCVDGQQQTVPIDVTDLTGTLTVNPDDDITCTFSNRTLVPHISITKTADPPVVNAGSNVTYTLVVVNDGEVPLTNVVVTDPLPSELTPVSADSTKGSCDLAQTITCDIGNLAVGEEVTIEIVAAVDPDVPDGTVIENRATVTGDPPVGASVDDASDVTVEVQRTTPPPPPVVRVATGSLPFTGSPTAMLLKAALWLLGLGVLLLLVVRLRRRRLAS